MKWRDTVQRCLIVGVLLGFGSVPYCSAENATGFEEPSYVQSSSSLPVFALFDEEVLADNVFSLRRRAAAMSLETRFEFLSKWVLPSVGHDSLRMQIDFTQSYPAPVVSNQELPRGRMIGTGAELVAPAIDLVTVATELNRLDAIQELVEAWQPGDGAKRKSRVAFLALVAIAQQDFPAAETLLRELFQLTAALPVSESERGPEAVAVWIAERHTATRELAQELVLRLYDDAAAEKHQRGQASLIMSLPRLGYGFAFQGAITHTESNPSGRS